MLKCFIQCIYQEVACLIRTIGETKIVRSISFLQLKKQRRDYPVVIKRQLSL